MGKHGKIICHRCLWGGWKGFASHFFNIVGILLHIFLPTPVLTAPGTAKVVVISLSFQGSFQDHPLVFSVVPDPSSVSRYWNLVYCSSVLLRLRVLLYGEIKRYKSPIRIRILCNLASFISETQYWLLCFLYYYYSQCPSEKSQKKQAYFNSHFDESSTSLVPVIWVWKLPVQKTGTREICIKAKWEFKYHCWKKFLIKRQWYKNFFFFWLKI